MSTLRRTPKPLTKIVAPSARTLIPGLWIGVTVPAQPAPECNPNDSSRPRKKAKARKTLREAAYLATTDVINAARLSRDETPFPLATRLAVAVTIGWGKGRAVGGAVDDDNAAGCVKGLIDGFAQAIGVDDSWFDQAPVEQVRDQEGLGWCRIEAAVVAGQAGQGERG